MDILKICKCGEEMVFTQDYTDALIYVCVDCDIVIEEKILDSESNCLKSSNLVRRSPIKQVTKGTGSFGPR